MLSEIQYPPAEHTTNRRTLTGADGYITDRAFVVPDGKIDYKPNHRDTQRAPPQNILPRHVMA